MGKKFLLLGSNGGSNKREIKDAQKLFDMQKIENFWDFSHEEWYLAENLI